MRILLTGGTGFIGKNIKEQLAGKYTIDAPPSESLDLLCYDVVERYLKEGHFDIVIHTATWNATRNSPKDLTKVTRNNLKMYFNIARCQSHFGRMIYYGSGAEFDTDHWISRMSEEYFDSHVPSNDYGFSKYVMAKYTEKSEGIVDLRLFAVFGKYEDPRIRFISNACCKAVLDMPITIKANRIFDYLYIDDLVRITEWFIEHEPKKKFYNICTGRVFDFITIAEKIIKASGKALDIVIANSTPGLEYSGDNSLLLGEIGGYTFLNLDSCISELYQWYLSRKESIDREKFTIDL